MLNLLFLDPQPWSGDWYLNELHKEKMFQGTGLEITALQILIAVKLNKKDHKYWGGGKKKKESKGVFIPNNDFTAQ